MGINATASGRGAAGASLLPEAYRILNKQRIDIDQRITALPPDDPARIILWQELESLLVRLRQVVSDLAKSPATHLLEMQAKAAVLATLLQPDETDGGPILPEEEKSALALSLTDDVSRLSVN